MTSRRSLLQAGLAAGFPLIVKAQTLGRAGGVAASDRVTLATIGCGNMGTGHLTNFLKLPAAKVLAVCDVFDEHLTKAKDRVDQRYGNKDCATYRAFEEVLARRDIDAVTMAVPDHWHGIVAVSALRAGKDVYGEKPLAHNLREGLAIVNHVAKYNRIWQTGSWQRSRENFHRACELVRNGRVGKVTRVEVGLPGGPFGYGKLADKTPFVDPPAGFQWDRWLGPGPEARYSEARAHFNWRWALDYGGGQLMDWVGHHVDIAHWGMGWDETGPYQVEGVGEYPERQALWNSAKRYRIEAKYPGGVDVVIAGGHDDIRGGTRWNGDKGWIWVNRGALEAGPASILEEKIGENEIHLTKSSDHYAQFLECVKSRKETITPARIAHRSATPGWLGHIAMITGRRLRWDAEKQDILHDPSARELLGREMRAPWRL